MTGRTKSKKELEDDKKKTEQEAAAQVSQLFWAGAHQVVIYTPLNNDGVYSCETAISINIYHCCSARYHE